MDVRTWDAALLSAAALERSGVSRAALRERLRRGEVVRLRAGWFVPTSVWDAATPEQRHLLRVLATARVNPDAVFGQVSAAVLHGWPVVRADLDVVHVIAPGSNGVVSRSELVARHDMVLDEADVVRIGHVRCTSPDRTVCDVARAAGEETAVAIADAAQRAEAQHGRYFDHARATRWRDRLLQRTRAGTRNVRRVRFVIGFADGGAQSPGESVSRLYLFRLGFAPVRVQVPVVGPRGESWEVDLGVEGALAEFDGAGKYLRTELTGGEDAGAVVMREKRRENAIRAITGLPVARWGWAELASVDALRAHLAAYGLTPRGSIPPRSPR
jgi:hypothetical protein